MRPDPPAAEQGTAAAGRPDEKRLSHPAVVPAAGKGMFALNFDDADVYMTIQTVFGEALKLNYVVDPRVKGRVTFRAVSPIPRESVLPLMEVILRLNGIGMVEDNGLYRIVPISDISKEPSPVSYGRNPESIPATGKSLVQVVPILYAQSSEILKLITPFASTNALLIDVPKGKQIIIVDTDANVKRLLKLVEVFDNEGVKRKKPQVFTYQVQNGKAKDIAALLQQIFIGGRGMVTNPAASSATVFGGQNTSSSAASSFPGSPLSMTSTSSIGAEMLVSEFTRIIHDEITNQIVVLSSPEDYAAIRETIERIDLVPRQVVIEGLIASVALTDNLSLGLAGLLKGNILNLDASFGLNLGSLNVDKNGLSTSGFTFVGTDIGGQVRGLITALATESKAKLLATPYILVSDNKEAKIQVGQQVPLVTSETYGTTGVAPMRSIQYRDIGIILKVKPRVNDGGLVTLDLDQEVSTFSTITLFANEQQIILNKTAATTNLVVQDNQTLVIGGLIREDTSKSRSGIPFLSKIPFIGWLFGNTDDNTTRQELIILLTPHVVKNQAEAKNLSSDYIDNMAESSKGRIKKEELMKAGTGKRDTGTSPEKPGSGQALPVHPPALTPASAPSPEGR
jgi:type II secretory pathway component GspD/PulD (secretin)